MSLLISFYWVNYYCNDGAVLMNYSTFVKDTLFEKIYDMAQYQWLFVQNTEKNFIRLLLESKDFQLQSTPMNALSQIMQSNLT